MRTQGPTGSWTYLQPGEKIGEHFYSPSSGFCGLFKIDLGGSQCDVRTAEIRTLTEENYAAARTAVKDRIARWTSQAKYQQSTYSKVFRPVDKFVHRDFEEHAWTSDVSGLPPSLQKNPWEGPTLLTQADVQEVRDVLSRRSDVCQDDATSH